MRERGKVEREGEGKRERRDELVSREGGEREREGEKEGERDRERERQRECMCVCV